MNTSHKHLKLDQRKLDRARRFFQVKTESAAVERALDLVLEEETIVSAHERVAGVGGLVDEIFGVDQRKKPRRKRRG